jgi:hypothetical protein
MTRHDAASGSRSYNRRAREADTKPHSQVMYLELVAMLIHGYRVEFLSTTECRVHRPRRLTYEQLSSAVGQGSTAAEALQNAHRAMREAGHP